MKTPSCSPAPTRCSPRRFGRLTGALCLLDIGAAWGQACEAHIFGHALLEKLIAPYKACTGHAWIVEVEPAYFLAADAERRAILDLHVSDRLASEPVSSRCFTPLPVLGVPGWWQENEARSFYDDPHVFRPGRRRIGA